MRRLLKFFLYFLVFLLFLSISTITLIDPDQAKEKPYYTAMMNRLDSINSALEIPTKSLSQVGSAKVSITPDSVMALAGYGARKPMEFDAILDSVFVRTIVLKSENQKVAILTADLLIIHPEMTRALYTKLERTDWSPSEIFLSATHTHSSLGQWAPGLVGGLFAGDYNEGVADIIADRMVKSLTEAEKNLSTTSIGFSSSENPDLVLNRLVGIEGREDRHMKNLFFRTGTGDILFSSFSAHATCLTSQSRNLSGDFPSYFHKQFDGDSSILFSQYAAGPVASMGPETPHMHEVERTKYLGQELAQRAIRPKNFEDSISMLSFSIPLELGVPQFKISQNLVLRPYLFNYAFGDEPAQINVLLLGNTLLIGTPCDFSGELALPLYRIAKQSGLELIITSFNGGYIGYITRDKWFDLEKYETRTMNWYGPGNGAYFMDIIKKIIEGVDAAN